MDGVYFPQRFFVDAVVNGINVGKYFETQEQAMAYAAKLIGNETISTARLECWNEEHVDDDDFINIHEFDVVDC